MWSAVANLPAWSRRSRRIYALNTCAVYNKISRKQVLKMKPKPVIHRNNTWKSFDFKAI